MSRTPSTPLFKVWLIFGAFVCVRRAICLIGLSLTLWCGLVTRVYAQVTPTGARAMPAVVNVGLPVPTEHTLAVAGALGYGYLDELDGQPSAGRALGSLALAFSPAPQLTLAVDVAGRRDGFDDGANWYGEPRLGARFATGLSKTHFLGAALDVRLIGAEAPSIEWQATSPALEALYGARLSNQTWLAFELGFELDRSLEAVPALKRMSNTDERTLSASSWNAVPVGIGVTHELGRSWQLLGEVSGKWLVGADAPAVLQSPWRVSAGARHRLSPSWVAQLALDVALSVRDSLAASQTLSREPRVAGLLAVAWSLPNEVHTPVKRPTVVAATPAVVEPAPVDVPEPPKASTVNGTLVDEGGRPMADAQVVLFVDGAEVARERTTAEGQFSFPQVALGAVVLRVNEPGYEALEVALQADEPRSAELVLRPAVPAGQVLGKVLDLHGYPIMATITVNPGERHLTAAADGSFVIDLAPGRYTLRFEHPNFVPQRRTVVVKDRGAVILNIGLVR